MDADTIFPTGSTGKAFTVAALGILVDQGKIGWDDKVIDRPARLPDVRPLGHARDDHPRPAGAPQRAGPGRRGPDVRAAHQPHAAPSPCAGCATSSRRPASAAASPTTTCSTWWPGQLIESVTGRDLGAVHGRARAQARRHAALDQRLRSRTSRRPTARSRTRAWTAASAASARRSCWTSATSSAAPQPPPVDLRSVPTTWRAGCRSSCTTASCPGTPAGCSPTRARADVDPGGAAADRARGPTP